LVPSGMLLLVIAPFLIWIFLLAIASLVDSAFRDGLLAGGIPPYPGWRVFLTGVDVYLWPLWLAAALAVALIRKLSGGLRVWPRYMSRLHLLGLLRRLRSEGARFDNWRQIIIGVVIGVGSALLTFWFTK
jgi:hypothetical protein